VNLTDLVQIPYEKRTSLSVARIFIRTTKSESHKMYRSNLIIKFVKSLKCLSQQLRGLRGRSTAARLLRLWVRIPPGAWTSVCCECCVLSGRGLCNELITSPEESYRLWRVVVCDLETSQEEAKGC